MRVVRKEIVSLILEKEGRILVEKRKASKETTPNCLIFPAGHVEFGEEREEALRREMKEELGIILGELELVYVGEFDCEEKQRIFFYRCKSFEGEMQKNEAEDLIWISPEEFQILSHDISRKAFAAYRDFAFEKRWR
jgi:mutator protein MutT